MDDTKRHVVEDVQASELPARFRGDIDPKEFVTVAVTVKEAAEPSFAEMFDALHESRVLSDDPVMRIRALREEWEDRDRFIQQIRRGGTGG